MIAPVLVASLLITALLEKSNGQVDFATGSAKPEDPILIVPGVGVGRVKAGMTEDEVEAALGKPDRMQGEVMVYDSQFGFSVVCSRNKIVGAVFCGSSVPAAPGRGVFKGRTKEGLGLGSSRDDVVKALGKPTSARPWAVGQEQLEYRPLGLTFLVEGGKVFHITVNLRPSPGNPKRAPIDPAPRKP